MGAIRIIKKILIRIYITILIIIAALVLLFSCSARKVNKGNTEIKTEVKTEIKEVLKEVVKKEEVKKDSIISTNEKQVTETNNKTLKRTSYYENGNLKSVTEATENFTSLTNEKNFYKSLSETLQNEVIDKESEINSLKAEKTSLESKSVQIDKKQTNVFFWIGLGVLMCILAQLLYYAIKNRLKL